MEALTAAAYIPLFVVYGKKGSSYSATIPAPRKRHFKFLNERDKERPLLKRQGESKASRCNTEAVIVVASKHLFLCSFLCCRYTHAKSERKLAGATLLDVAYVTRGVPLNIPVTTSWAVVAGWHTRCFVSLHSYRLKTVTWVTFNITLLLDDTTLTADKRTRRLRWAPRCGEFRSRDVMRQSAVTYALPKSMTRETGLRRVAPRCNESARASISKVKEKIRASATA